jgi:CheY-like chemotaxis protein
MAATKILIVEDECPIAMDVAACLTRLGYYVIGVAESSDRALQLAGVERPHLALMDIRLTGGLDGIDTAALLRAHYGIPVVYLTGYADDTTLQRAKATEPLGYLVKPFAERELHSTLTMAAHRLVAHPHPDEPSPHLHAPREVLPHDLLPDQMAALDELAADFAHDFNNLLSGILMNAEIVLHGEPNLSPKSQERLAAITEQARRAAALVQRVLDLGHAATVPFQPPDSESSPAARDPRDDEFAATLPIEGNQQTILLVEDNPSAQCALADALELLNYRTVTASNGRHALALLDQPDTHVDLILSDLDMPEMDGLELCRAVQRRHLSTRMIILTGHVSEEMLQELRFLGIAGYLTKPVRLDQLQRAVAAALAGPVA